MDIHYCSFHCLLVPHIDFVNQCVQLTSSILDTDGPFQMLNALRMLTPDASHTLLMCFMPHQGKVIDQMSLVFMKKKKR